MSTLFGPAGQALTGEGTPAPAASSSETVATTTQTFMRDVIEASRETVVLVDFWAPWCGPCKQLTPLLEKVVRGYSGAVRLVTMNIDEHPDIAGQLGIRSIPAVIAFRNGQPMDGFVGAQTEQQLRTFMERVAGPAQDSASDLIAAAEAARAAGDLERATMLYSEVLQHDPSNSGAIAGLGLVSVDAGNIDAARGLLDQLPPELRQAPAIQSVEAAIALAEQAAGLGGAAALRAAVDAEPNNHQARFDLAVALAAEGDRTGAVDELVTIMRRDRDWNDGAAKDQLITFFDAWGPTDPATQAGRRKLGSVLFA